MKSHGVAMSQLPYYFLCLHNDPLLPTQSQCVLMEFTIKWVTQTDNEAIMAECDKRSHGGSPGACESTEEAPGRAHLVRDSQGGLHRGR